MPSSLTEEKHSSLFCENKLQNWFLFLWNFIKNVIFILSFFFLSHWKMHKLDFAIMSYKNTNTLAYFGDNKLQQFISIFTKFDKNHDFHFFFCLFVTLNDAKTRPCHHHLQKKSTLAYFVTINWKNGVLFLQNLIESWFSFFLLPFVTLNDAKARLCHHSLQETNTLAYFGDKKLKKIILFWQNSIKIFILSLAFCHIERCINYALPSQFTTVKHSSLFCVIKLQKFILFSQILIKPWFLFYLFSFCHIERCIN